MHLYFYKFVDIFFFSIYVCFDVTTFVSGTRLSLIRSLGCSLVRLLICHHSNNPVISLLPAGLLSRKIWAYRRDTCTQHIWMFQCADTLFYQTVSAMTSVSLLIGQSLLLNKQRKANCVWAGAARDHFPVLTVLCPPLQLDAGTLLCGYSWPMWRTWLNGLAEKSHFQEPMAPQHHRHIQPFAS